MAVTDAKSAFYFIGAWIDMNEGDIREFLADGLWEPDADDEEIRAQVNEQMYHIEMAASHLMRENGE